MKLMLYMTSMAVAMFASLMLIQYQSSAQSLAGQLNSENATIMDQVGFRIQDRIAGLTDGWVDPGAERRERERNITAKADQDRRKAGFCALIAGAAMAISVLLSMLHPPSLRRRLMAVVSFVCWVMGILLPVLTITVSANVEHIGTLVLREETKSLLLMLEKLTSQENWLMVALIGVFGIGVPILKTACNFMPDELTQAHRFGGWLSRWSLVDVIVIGVAVAFFGGRGDSETYTTIGLGFWFFAGCGVVSILIGMMEGRRPMLPCST